MAHHSDLTSNDDTVLSKIFDPESAPNARLMVDSLLPRDPHTSEETLQKIQGQERSIIDTVEKSLGVGGEPDIGRNAKLAEAYSQLSSLIDTFPEAASLRNNRAQLSRMMLGPMLTSDSEDDEPTKPSLPTLLNTVSDLDKAIELCQPPAPSQAISPFQCRILGQAYTQRAALFHSASKDPNLMAKIRKLGKQFSDWDANDFKEAASQDFFMGGRYGNEIGKALAVHTNPTAKLCGQMVQEAMKREMAVGPSAS